MIVRHLLALLVCILAPSVAFAHPGAGMVVDARGNVYFVVFGTNQIMKMTPRGDVSVFVADGYVSLPHHLTLGRDGMLYTASDSDGRVYRIDSAGGVSLFVDSRRFAGRTRLLVGARGDPFTVDGDGNIYALPEPNAAAIVRISRAGTITRLASNARMNPMHFQAMAWGPDGALYASDQTRVWRIANDTAQPIRPANGGLEVAVGVAVDRDGNIWVADYRAGRVVRMSPRGVVNTPTALAGERFRGPTGVAVRGDTVYVLDNGPSSMRLWRYADGDLDSMYTEDLFGWYAPRLFVTIPLLLIGLLFLNRWSKRRSAKPLSTTALSG